MKLEPFIGQLDRRAEPGRDKPKCAVLVAIEGEIGKRERREATARQRRLDGRR